MFAYLFTLFKMQKTWMISIYYKTENPCRINSFLVNKEFSLSVSHNQHVPSKKRDKTNTISMRIKTSKSVTKPVPMLRRQGGRWAVILRKMTRLQAQATR